MNLQEKLYFDKGCAYMNKGKFEFAIIEFTNALGILISGAAYENRASAKTFIGDFEGAIEDYASSIEISKNNLRNAPHLNKTLVCRDLTVSLFNIAYFQSIHTNDITM